MDFDILSAFAQYHNENERSEISHVDIFLQNKGACPHQCGFTHINAEWVDTDLIFQEECSRLANSDPPQLRSDGSELKVTLCRAGCGLIRKKKWFKFHDCIGVALRGFP